MMYHLMGSLEKSRFFLLGLRCLGGEIIFQTLTVSTICRQFEKLPFCSSLAFSFGGISTNWATKSLKNNLINNTTHHNLVTIG